MLSFWESKKTGELICKFNLQNSAVGWQVRRRVDQELHGNEIYSLFKIQRF